MNENKYFISLSDKALTESIRLIETAIDEAILKSNKSKCYTRFDFKPKTGMELPKRFILISDR